MDNATSSKKSDFFTKVIGTAIAAILIFFFVFDGYTYIMGRVHKVCGFDGAYIIEYEEENTTLVYIFDENIMNFYFITDDASSLVTYEYEGKYYNKGLSGKFLDLDDVWVDIPDAEKAGEFYADCKSNVVSTWSGYAEHLDEREIEELEEKENRSYSEYYYFKENGDSFTLIYKDNDEYYSIPLTKVTVLTGRIGEEVELLNELLKDFSA